MKLTKSHLKQIIKEELDALLNENDKEKQLATCLWRRYKCPSSEKRPRFCIKSEIDANNKAKRPDTIRNLYPKCF